MLRYQCNKCGKVVEFLKVYGKDHPRQRHCSCGGALIPLNNIDPNQGGEKHENSHASKKRTSE